MWRRLSVLFWIGVLLPSEVVQQLLVERFQDTNVTSQVAGILKERDNPRPTGIVAKIITDQDFLGIPWQTLALLQPPKAHRCESNTNEPLTLLPLASLFDGPSWLRTQPNKPVGHCPVRFSVTRDPRRIWPKFFVIAECACEGSRCVKSGAHQCVTVYISRVVVYKPNATRKREIVPVGCVCAAKTATSNSLSRRIKLVN